MPHPIATTLNTITYYHHLPFTIHHTLYCTLQGELDYYVNGTTGETSYDKPIELMTMQEKVYYDNFKNHQGKAEEHVKTIDKLQVMIRFDSILFILVTPLHFLLFESHFF